MKRNFISEGKINLKTVSKILLMLLLSHLLLANGFGLGIGETLNSYMQFVVYIFRWITGIAIIVTIFLFFQGRPIWTMGLGFVGFAAAVANIDKILNALGLTGGFTF
ncbi:MAG: hypothetical protein HUJ88_12960 [Fusobacterium necrophorum]|nr:hypothetical protein [Fusobacterium necrophorum]